MRKIKIHLIAWLMLGIFLSSNAVKANLPEKLHQLKGKLQTVETKNYTYEQELEWQEDRPFSLQYTVIEIDKKGKTLEESYHFNLADFEVNTVKWSDEKDKIIVALTTDNRRKTIKYFKDNEQQNYIYDFQLIAQDIDNAKNIEKLLEEIIPEGKKIADAELQLNSFEERKKWLEENIGDFSIEEDSYEQSIENIEEHPTLLQYTFISNKGKSTQKDQWIFNLTDINPQSIQLEVKSKEVFVELATRRNQKYIRHLEAGELDSYDSKLQIHTAEIDIARHLTSVLKDLIPESEEKMKIQSPIPTTQDAALQYLADNIGGVTEKENTYQQSFKANCLTVLDLKGTEKDKPIDESFTLQLADLNERSLEIDVSGTTLWLKANTLNKQSLIQVEENGELQNYTDDFALRANDIENAKSLLTALEVATKTCRDNLQFEVPQGDVKAQFAWLNENVQNVAVEDTEYVQELSAESDDPCKWELKRATTTEKKNTEEVFQFNLNYLDAKKIDFDISKKEVAVWIPTKHSEKVVKYFQDGEPDDYQKGFSIHCQNVEQARNIIESFKRAIEDCKK